MNYTGPHWPTLTVLCILPTNMTAGRGLWHGEPFGLMAANVAAGLMNWGCCDCPAAPRRPQHPNRLALRGRAPFEDDLMLIFKNNVVASVMLGDCLTSLATLPDRSVNSCVTSPPYYGLRDYGNAGQIGLEESPDVYVAKLIAVFREVRRVLTDDGTLWLNIGDSYNNSNKWGRGGANTGKHSNGKVPSWEGVRRKWKGLEGIKPKDMIGIPWMLAFALRADGWYLRQDIIWNKPNPMPESVRDRCTKAHEYIFLLSKSERYYFDHDVMKEDAVGGGERSRRSVWTVTSKPYKGAHFAVYPPELIEPCILAGCPEGGTVLDPFGGSGTTGGVALKHGRNAVICELNGDYAALMPARIEAIAC